MITTATQLTELDEAMARKGIIPGESRCCFLHPDPYRVIGCEAQASHVVIEHRPQRGRFAAHDVVMPGCPRHAHDFLGDARFTVLAFDAIEYERRRG